MHSPRKIFFFFLFFICFFFPSTAFCEEVLVFHFERTSDNSLLLRTGTVPSIEKTEDPKFSIISFLKDNPSSGEYQMNLYDITGALIGTFFFNSSESSFSYTIPYFGIAERYTIFDTKRNILLLEGTLASFISCNNNGVCEYEKNETSDTCVSDCGSKASYSEKTKELLRQKNITPQNSSLILPQNNPSIPQSTPRISPYFIALAIGIFILIFTGTFLLIRKRIIK